MGTCRHEADADSVEAEIRRLADLDLVLLRQRWRELYDCDPPARISRPLLLQAIAYRLQEQALGELSRAEGNMLSRGYARSGPRTAPRHRIKPGTRFLREWQGRTHEVTATAEATFLYRGREYASLSAVAREISGTRWSGPAFFGLNGTKGRHG